MNELTARIQELQNEVNCMSDSRDFKDAESVRPSAGNSFDPKDGRSSKDCGADQQRLQISDPHFDKFPNPATFACWKIQD